MKVLILDQSTRAVPTYEVPQQTPPSAEDNPDLEGLVLDMKELAETGTGDFRVKLGALATTYKRWIEEQQQRIQNPEEGLSIYTDVANEALQLCRRTLERIQEGLETIATNEQAAEAFRFANRAMWQQRVRSIFAAEVRREQKPVLAEIDVPRHRTWYPFQLAFILLNLPSLTDVNHRDRSTGTSATADLFWFPTGGGKTEAYLGLAAYTMAIRRLQGVVADRPGDNGVAVLMRYTLRLLTLQPRSSE